MSSNTRVREVLFAAIASGTALAACKQGPAKVEPPPATAASSAAETVAPPSPLPPSPPTSTAPPPTRTAPPPTSTPPATSPPPPATSLAPTSPEPPTAATTAAKPPSPRPRDCREQKRYCTAPNTPPHFEKSFGFALPYDVNGCLPREVAATPCSGMHAFTGPSFVGGQCCYDVCQGEVPPCGRPFLVGHAARLARGVIRDDWARDAGRAACADLAIERAWLDDAAAEHASVASFARFTLDLFAAGAPRALVAAALRAASDEIEHARLCFGFAASHGERVFGPARLPIAGARPCGALADLAAATAVEACVGETVGALVAARAAELASDAAVRAGLERIAGDELAHAALGWQTVAWTLAAGGAEVRTRVAAALASALDELTLPSSPRSAGDARWRAAGRLDTAELGSVAHEARTLIGAAREQLFAA